MTTPTPKVLTEADLAGLPRAVSTEDALRFATLNEDCAYAWLDSSEPHKFRMDTGRTIRALVSERDALAGRVAELERDAARYCGLLNQARDALNVYQRFIDDAHILEGQWHWLDDAKPAAAAIDAALSTTPESKP